MRILWIPIIIFLIFWSYMIRLLIKRVSSGHFFGWLIGGSLAVTVIATFAEPSSHDGMNAFGIFFVLAVVALLSTFIFGIIYSIRMSDSDLISPTTKTRLLNFHSAVFIIAAAETVMYYFQLYDSGNLMKALEAPNFDLLSDSALIGGLSFVNIILIILSSLTIYGLSQNKSYVRFFFPLTTSLLLIDLGHFILLIFPH